MAEASKVTKYNRWFDREHLKTDLKNKSIKGGVSTVGSQGIMFGLSMISTVVLARLLSPEDYGLLALVSSVTGFVLIFKDLGLSQAIIQYKDLDQAKSNKVFWFNVLVSSGIALLICALGPVLVYFYDEPRVLYITFSFSMIAVFGGLTIQHSSLLRRQMMFKTIAIVNIVSSLASIGGAILLAYLGFGYWALVAMNVINPFVTMIMYWIYCDWRPDMPKIDRSISGMVRFGVDITGFNLINYFSRNLDNVLIGKYVGTAQLGIYSKAYQLLMLPITQLRNPLVNVGIPAMSSLVDNLPRYRDYYRKYVFLLAFFSMPIVAFLAVSSYPIVYIILGPKWVEVSYIFSLLAIMAFMQPATSSCGLVLISLGQTRRYFYYGLFNAIIMVISFVIGIQWGTVGLIVASTIGYYIFLFPALIYSLRKTPAPYPRLYQPDFISLNFCLICRRMYLFNGLLLPGKVSSA